VIIVLGSISKALATMATQPLIVAKVGLQSKPPPVRNGKPFKSFIEVMRFIVEHEGLLGLFKGIGPQIMKGLLVQGFLMMAKERYITFSTSSLSTANKPRRIELTFILLFRYVRQVRAEKLQKLAEYAAEKARQGRPVLIK
jgi:hypothetical protein